MKGIKSFNLKNVLTSGLSLLIGGGANVLADWAIDSWDTSAAWDKKYVNAGKIAVGAIAGSMLDGKKYGIVKSAADGIAIVGATNLINDLRTGSGATTTNGVPFIGRVRVGQRAFRNARVRGTGKIGDVPFMG